jgi:hypothetical protein
MHSKVSSDWLPSYIKATRPVLEILKMAGYFPDSPRMCLVVRHRVPGTDFVLKSTCVSGVLAHDYVTHHTCLK